MLKEYKLQSILGIWGGVFAFLIGHLLATSDLPAYAGNVLFGYAVMVGSYFLFVSGCFMYAKGKGQSWGFGFLGLLGPLGILILYVLKDKSKMVLKKRRKEQSL